MLFRRIGDRTAWVRFGWGRSDNWLPVEDPRLERALDVARRDRLQGKDLASALGFKPHYLVAAGQHPSRGPLLQDGPGTAAPELRCAGPRSGNQFDELTTRQIADEFPGVHPTLFGCDGKRVGQERSELLGGHGLDEREPQETPRAVESEVVAGTDVERHHLVVNITPGHAGGTDPEPIALVPR